MTPAPALSPAPQRSVSVVACARGDEPDLVGAIATLRSASAQDLLVDVVVVLAGRTEAAAEPIRATGARVIVLPAAAGYARQVDLGLAQARFDTVALFDAADGYRATDLPRLLSHAHRYDMVIGAREGGGAGVGRRLARRSLRALAELCTGQVVPDPSSGFRVLRREVYARYAPLAVRGAGLSSILTIGAMVDGLQVAYVPVAYHAPQRKRQPIRDWVDLVHLLGRLALLFNPLRVFSMPGYALLGSGTLLLALGAFLDGRPNGWGVLLFLFGSIVLATAYLADVVGTAARFPRPVPSRGPDAKP